MSKSKSPQKLNLVIHNEFVNYCTFPHRMINY